MPQIENGIRSLLKLASMYNLFQWGIGASNVKTKFVKDFVRPEPQAIILDIGCGTGDMLDFLPETIQYYGFDLNQNYIDHAKRRFGGNAEFICCDINEVDILKNLPMFDIALAFGVLHHLNDLEALSLFSFAKKSLKKSGRLITLDGCFIENRSKIARFLVNQDRGQNVRTSEGYEVLAKQSFDRIKTTITHDLLRVPYTHLIMECFTED